MSGFLNKPFVEFLVRRGKFRAERSVDVSVYKTGYYRKPGAVPARQFRFSDVDYLAVLYYYIRGFQTVRGKHITVFKNRFRRIFRLSALYIILLILSQHNAFVNESIVF
jgi:hypothetical protein